MKKQGKKGSGRDVPRGTSPPGDGAAGSGREAGDPGGGPMTATLEVPFLAGALAEAGIALPEGGVEKLAIHAAEMVRWNRAISLTSITVPAEVAAKHIIDSLLLLKFAPFPGRTLDAGSGAGYPGIPLAVALPGSRFVLLDATAKKCTFLTHVLRRIGLSNAEVVRGRISK